jgi:hypothetical protein
MHSNRLGCFTGAGIIATLITLFAIVGFAFASGSQMFSAGALNAVAVSGKSYGGVTSHAQIAKCSDCHAAPFGAETMADRCASCHTDIAAQMKDVAKLHGAIMQKSSALACRDCHPDHRGASASLTDMGENAFPHEALGYSLKGHQRTATGAAFTCKDCHQQDITTFNPDTCDSCHRQIDAAFTESHVQAFGAKCIACHDGVDRFNKSFSHSGFIFQLNGKHADVTCEKCHLNARTVADLQSAPQDCFSCHQKDDKHEGQFGTDCSACHTPSSWSDATFDHNRAAFKLEGKHAEVKCEQCHVNKVFKGTPQDCYSCHQKDDKHKGSFGTDCSGCHTPKSWDGATFDHSRSAFKLEGKHANGKCEDCHKNGVFKGTPSTCVSCHADPAFHAGALGTDCASCHNTSDWNQAKFNLSHPEPRVGEGGSGVNHGGATCRQCHPSSVQQSTCTACHEGNPGGND